LNDPILDDLHATRERLLAEFGGTLADLVARLQREETMSGRTLWTPRRTKDCTQLTKTRYFGGWCCHQRTKYQATCRRLLGLDINPNSNVAAGEEIELPSLLGSLDDEPEEKETGYQCVACGSHKLRFIGQTPKPSWSELLTHEDVRCPEWYAVTEYAEFCNYLEREYGISYSDWYLEMRQESTMSEPIQSEPSQPQSARQLYLPGLCPESGYLIESY
jgi:hypothetical protein